MQHSCIHRACEVCNTVRIVSIHAHHTHCSSIFLPTGANHNCFLFQLLLFFPFSSLSLPLSLSLCTLYSPHLHSLFVSHPPTNPHPLLSKGCLLPRKVSWCTLTQSSSTVFRESTETCHDRYTLHMCNTGVGRVAWCTLCGVPFVCDTDGNTD